MQPDKYSEKTVRVILFGKNPRGAAAAALGLAELVELEPSVSGDAGASWPFFRVEAASPSGRCWLLRVAGTALSGGPRRTRILRKPNQKVSASEGPTLRPMISRRPSVLTATAIIAATETIPAALALLEVGGVEPRDRAIRLPAAVARKAPTRSSMSLQSLETCDFEMPERPIACTRSSTRRVGAHLRSRPLGSRRPRPSQSSSWAPGTAGSTSPAEAWDAERQRPQAGIERAVPIAVASQLVR